MIKRMIIMLVAVAVVLGGIFGFKALQGPHDQEVHGPMSVAAADGVDDKAGYRGMAVADRGGRQPARGERRRSLARGRRHRRRRSHFKSGDDVKAGKVLLEAARGRRRRQAAIAAGRPRRSPRSPTTATSSSSRRQAVSQPTRRHRRRQPARTPRRRSRSSRRLVDKKTSARRSPAISASARSISASISPPAPRSSRCRRSIRSIVDFYLPQQALDQIKVGQR